MDFDISPTQRAFLDRVTAFMDEHIYPAVPVYEAEMDVSGRRALEGRPGRRGTEGQGQGRRPVELLHAPAQRPGARRRHLPVRRRATDQPGIQPDRRTAGQGRLRFGSLQLLGARHRQHGSADALWHAGAKGKVAAPADERRDPFGLPDDRAGRGQFGRHQHRDPHRARRRPLCDQRPQVVVLGRGRPALQGRHRHGQDRSRQRQPPPAAEPGPGAAGRAGHRDRPHAAGVRLR